MFDHSRFLAASAVVQACSPFAIVPSMPTLQTFEQLESTNQTLWQLIAQGAPTATAVIAAQQHRGRGQWGRQWSSPLGGLYLSLGLTPNLPIAEGAQLTLAIAWGIATALREIPGRLSGGMNKVPVQLKWLNDLVLQGRKLGGILTETHLQGELITQAVVGIGINWVNPVPEPGIALKTWLQEQPMPLIESLEMLTAITLVGALSGYHQWQCSGITDMLPRYLDLLVNLGQSVTVSGRSGVVVGVMPTGDLKVRLSALAATRDQENLDLYLKPGAIQLGYG
jgi:BirA family transcriptional regulator, biotin operon repressor / biotin---[acetyl-CoA-carboxylase] ligase